MVNRIEDSFKLLFDAISQGVFFQKADGTLIDVNESALKMLGVTRDVFMGRTSCDPAWKVITEEGIPLPPEMHPSMMALRTGKVVEDCILGVYHPVMHDYVWLVVNAFPQFEKEESAPFQVFVTLYDITWRKLAEEKLKAEAIERQRTERELRRIEWLLSARSPRSTGEYVPPYGDLVPNDPSGLIYSTVGKTMLTDIVGDYLDLLDTSAAIYEKNGDYALGIFSSGWCRFMDAASRGLCNTPDNREALTCGKWMCHESCWVEASKAAIRTGQPADVECEGGIHIYAVPVHAGADIIGAVNVGYGDPPTDEVKLQELATTYGVTVEELRSLAATYESRPPFIIELAKKRLIASARLIGEIVQRKESEEFLRVAHIKYKTLFESFPLGITVADTAGTIVETNSMAEQLLDVPQTEHVQRNIDSPEWQILRPDGTPMPPDEFASVRALKQKCIVSNIETGIVRKDSTCTWLNVTAAPLPLEGYGVVVTYSDITERKKTEEIFLQREFLLNKIFDVLPVGLWLADKNGTLTRSNAKGREIWGAEPLVGQEHYGVFKARAFPSGKELEPQDWALAHTIQEGVTVLDEILEIDAFDGKKKIILNYTAPILDKTGKVDGAIIVNLDITERKKAEDALVRSEREFRQLAESMPQIVWVCQPDGKNVYFNHNWVEYTGLTLDESYGAGWIKRLHPDDRQRASQAWHNAINNNDTYLLECRLRRCDGEYFWWLIRGVPVVNENGEILKWFGTCTDIHEMKLNTAKIQDQLNELRRWNEAMLDREGRVLELKREVNALLVAGGKPVRYTSVVSEVPDVGQ